MQVTTKILIDKRRKRTSDGTYPVVVRVTYNRVPIKFSLGLHLSEMDFQKLSSPRLGEQLSAVKQKLEVEHKPIKDIITDIQPFSFKMFRFRFYSNHSPLSSVVRRNRLAQLSIYAEDNTKEGSKDEKGMHEETVKHAKVFSKRKYPRSKSEVNYRTLGPFAMIFGKYIRDLESQGKIGTSELYFSALMSLLAFRKDLDLGDITKQFLLEYEEWMLAKGNSYTTIGIYLRNVRALFNMCIEDGYIGVKSYPFGRRRYQVPTGRNVKKSLELAEIKLLYEYSSAKTTASELKSRDMWFFSFFGNGMNPKDIALLKFKNIEGDFIRFIRAKTKNTTRRSPQIISVYLNDDMRIIIERWSNTSKNPDDYIFPVLNKNCSPHGKRACIQQFIKDINKGVDFIAKAQGIGGKVRTMHARHSYSTVLKRAGVSMEFIQETLGHMSLKTTQNYLNSFTDDTKIEMAKALLAFKSL